MMIELGLGAAKLVSVLAPLLPEKGWPRQRGRGGGSDGMPITADNIFRQIKGKMEKEIQFSRRPSAHPARVPHSVVVSMSG